MSGLKRIEDFSLSVSMILAMAMAIGLNVLGIK
jgi:hypothetical protein